MTKLPAPPSASPADAEGPFRRWSRLKAQRRRQAAQRHNPPAAAGREAAPEPAATPEELPSIDTLDEHSKLGAFFTEAVCEDLRRRALRKIFHLQKYNVCDGLDDYAEDYTCFEPLGDIMTADLRLRREREQLKRALEKGAPEDEPDNAPDSPPESPATDRVERAGAPLTGEDPRPAGDAGEEPVRQS